MSARAVRWEKLGILGAAGRPVQQTQSEWQGGPEKKGQRKQAGNIVPFLANVWKLEIIIVVMRNHCWVLSRGVTSSDKRF